MYHKKLLLVARGQINVVENGLSRAINIIGGQSFLAKKIGTTQSAVSGWVSRGQVPAKYIKKISEATNNMITVEEFLSDHEENARKKQ